MWSALNLTFPLFFFMDYIYMLISFIANRSSAAKDLILDCQTYQRPALLTKFRSRNDLSHFGCKIGRKRFATG